MKKLMGMWMLLLLLACGGVNQAQDQQVDPIRFDSLIQAMPEAQVLDVRTPVEFQSGYIQGAINIDYNGSGFKEEIQQLNKKQPVLVYCLSGGRSHSAAKFLRSQGFEVVELDGGMASWKSKNLPVEGQSPSGKSGMDRIQFMASLDSNVLHLVDFNAKWCLPCRILVPIVDSLGTAYKEEMRVHKIDYDRFERLAREFQVEGIPYVVLIKNGTVVWSHFGLPNTDELVAAIDSNL